MEKGHTLSACRFCGERPCNCEQKDMERLAEQGIDETDIQQLRTTVEFQTSAPNERGFDAVIVWRPLLNALLDHVEEQDRKIKQLETEEYEDLEVDFSMASRSDYGL
jgi:hypothetical protein